MSPPENWTEMNKGQSAKVETTDDAQEIECHNPLA